MPAAIADYALLGDGRSGALVSLEGSLDWMCLPRFDSRSIFAALLGDEEQGCWSLRPTDPSATATRTYRGDTFELVTRWQTATGVAEVHDVMPVIPLGYEEAWRSDVIRRIDGIEGEVEFAHTLRLRFDYAKAVPWVIQRGTDHDPAMVAIAGPDAVVMRGVKLRADRLSHVGTVTVAAGDRETATLTWYPSHLHPPEPFDTDAVMKRTRRWWNDWAERIDATDVHAAAVTRSILVLRALTNRATGGIVAAATTSLPEQIGGTRNWDYRYVWLRDAALTLQVMLAHGFVRVAKHWRDWLLRAIAGEPEEMQILYGLAGERDLPERIVPTLPGYRGSAPVRIGNAAVDQYQADVAGEVLVALSDARLAGLEDTPFSWPLERAILQTADARFDLPDNGIWEIRGEPRLFVQSRAMMWAAFDRGVRAIEQHGLDGPLDRWKARRDQARAEIDEHGVAAGGWFVQAYGSDDVDAAVLLLPQVGFCAYDDPRMLATVARFEEQLMDDGLLLRYRTSTGVDGIAGGEHPFLTCSFWLVEQYAASGRVDDAERLLDRLCGFANDVGLLSEEYDPHAGELLGNMPQALSHLSLVRAADAVARARAGMPPMRRGLDSPAGSVPEGPDPSP